jgi:glycosyltransferase involved in cell wall biosynthesis
MMQHLTSFKATETERLSTRIILYTTHYHTIRLFRLQLLKYLRIHGFDICVIANLHKDQDIKEVLRSNDIGHINIKIASGLKGLLFAIADLLLLRNASNGSQQSNTIMITYFMKGIIFAAIATLGQRNCTKIAIVEGLGKAFTKKKDGGPQYPLIEYAATLVYRATLRLYDGVIFLNESDKNELITKRAVKAQYCHVWGPIGIDTDTWSPSASTDNNKQTFVFVGRFILEKGIKEYCEAARFLLKSGCNCKFVALGTYDDFHKSNSLKAYISAMNEEGYVFTPGHMEVRDILRSASALVLPTYYREGYPLVIQEAFALGTPVITTKHANCENEVVDGVTGYIVPCRDPIKLAEAIKEFIIHPQLSQMMGGNCREIALSRFNNKITNKEFLNILNKILERKKVYMLSE